MILVIAEKPSVGAAIGKVLGASCRKDGYLEGNNYIVSWCVGHLVGLADASSYDERFAKWRYSDLPIVPDEWLFEVPKDKQKQFKVLCDLMLDKRVTELVCATDAGREGELIFRLVYKKAGCTKPFKRLWISSLEDSAIREGFAHLRSSGEYDRLYEAALARSKADWIVGINGTRLFSTLYHKKLVVGRVQTPTLAMLVEREGKISTFHKEKYFNVHISKENLTADLEKVKTEEEAKAVAAACDKKQAVVSSLKKETKTVNPPRLYDLTTLQREANRYYGFTAQQALDLVQSLYEKKLLTYPRTDSQFITEDMESTARQVIGIVSRKLPLFGGITHEPDIGRITNNAKVTDHHAIIPTVQLEKQDLGELPESEQKIIRLVAMRLLSATGEKHIYDETSVTLTCEGYEFRAKGKTVVQDGWKAIERRFKESLKSKEKDEPERSLPSLNEKDTGDSWNRYFDGTLEDIPDEYRVTGSGEELEQPTTMTVLVVEPDKKPYVKEIPSGLESLQHEVGGSIQAVYPFAEPVAVICNEEGKLEGLPLNRALRDEDGEIYDIVAGTFLVTGLTDDSFGSLSPDLLRQFMTEFKMPEQFAKIGDRIVAIPMISEEQQKQTVLEEKSSIVNENTSGMAVDGHIGTWHTIDHKEIDGHTFWLMEHDTFGDDASCIIVDERGELVLSHIYDGFDETAVNLLRQEVMPVEKMPDDSISIEEMKQYGYKWGGMLPMREEAAAEVMKSCQIYRLYGDDTEGLVLDAKEVPDHAAKGGIFGVEKSEWKAMLERQNPLKTAEMSVEDDYGMIDGIINNGSKEKESSEKREKSSIMDRLKAAKSSKPQVKSAPSKEKKSERDL